MYNKLCVFKFPERAAFAYVEFITTKEQLQFKSVCLSLGYKAVLNKTRTGCEVVFWPDGRKPFNSKNYDPKFNKPFDL